MKVEHLDTNLENKKRGNGIYQVTIVKWKLVLPGQCGIGDKGLSYMSGFAIMKIRRGRFADYSYPIQAISSECCLTITSHREAWKNVEDLKQVSICSQSKSSWFWGLVSFLADIASDFGTFLHVWLHPPICGCFWQTLTFVCHGTQYLQCNSKPPAVNYFLNHAPLHTPQAVRLQYFSPTFSTCTVFRGDYRCDPDKRVLPGTVWLVFCCWAENRSWGCDLGGHG